MASFSEIGKPYLAIATCPQVMQWIVAGGDGRMATLQVNAGDVVRMPARVEVDDLPYITARVATTPALRACELTQWHDGLVPEPGWYKVTDRQGRYWLFAEDGENYLCEHPGSRHSRALASWERWTPCQGDQ